MEQPHPRCAATFAAFTLLLAFLLSAPLRADESVGSRPLPGNVPHPDNEVTDTKMIPLPIYATLPNEGSTYGLMPVFLVVDKKTQHTQSIYAPSISWNRIINYTGTFRWYYYPADDEAMTLIPSVSSNVNRNLTLEYQKLPPEKGRVTREGWFHLRRSIFYRFFGIGPQSNAGDQTSYTSLGGDAGGRIGFNFADKFNAGISAQFQRQLVEKIAVYFLPLTTDYFQGVPGFGGSTEAYEALSLRYDSRDSREYSKAGTAAEVLAGAAQGLVGTNAYARIQLDSRTLWDEIPDHLYGAARVFWSYTPGANIPFYDQSSLGGSFRMRGFTENRFIDKGAWTAEIEQRITILKMKVYGVVADWRIDPFFEVGQVYHDFSQFTQYVKYAGGLGFRAFVEPNVVGRVDVAVAGEGVKVYVELGYPY